MPRPCRGRAEGSRKRDAAPPARCAHLLAHDGQKKAPPEGEADAAGLQEVVEWGELILDVEFGGVDAGHVLVTKKIHGVPVGGII